MQPSYNDMQAPRERKDRMINHLSLAIGSSFSPRLSGGATPSSPAGEGFAGLVNASGTGEPAALVGAQGEATLQSIFKLPTQGMAGCMSACTVETQPPADGTAMPMVMGEESDAAILRPPELKAEGAPGLTGKPDKPIIAPGVLPGPAKPDLATAPESAASPPDTSEIAVGSDETASADTEIADGEQDIQIKHSAFAEPPAVESTDLVDPVTATDAGTQTQLKTAEASGLRPTMIETASEAAPTDEPAERVSTSAASPGSQGDKAATGTTAPATRQIELPGPDSFASNVDAMAAEPSGAPAGGTSAAGEIGPKTTVEAAGGKQHAMPGDTPTVSARQGEIGRQLGVEVARQTQDGRDSMTIRLDPAELGRIQVRLQFDDQGSLRAHVSAESPAVLEMLRRDSADLARALNDAGVRTDSQSFQFDGRGQRDSQQGQRNGQDLSHNHHPEQTSPETETSIEASQVRLSAHGGVDLIA